MQIDHTALLAMLTNVRYNGFMNMILWNLTRSAQTMTRALSDSGSGGGGSGGGY